LTTPDTDTLSPFDACWLAEAMRLHALDTADPARPASPAAAPTDAATLLTLTHSLAQQQGYPARVQRWHSHARWLLGGLGLLATLAGFSAGLTLVGGAARSVNVLWALLGLIGVHSAALLFWLLFGQGSGGAAGRLWFALLQRWGLGASIVPGRPDPLARALLNLLARDGLGRWWLGMITHALWLLALAAALLALLAVLSLRSVSFTLETTILPAAVFAGIVEGLGAAPAWLGFAVPTPEMIEAALGSAAAAQDVAAGRIWASWLCGCVLVYALLPRTFAFLVCQTLLRRRRTRCQPALHLPGFALLPGLQPAGPGIVDPARAPETIGRVAPLHHVHSHGSLLAGLELGADISWPPRGLALRAEVVVEERVDTREQRRALLARLKAAPPARLLLCMDGRLSPDRGSLRALVDCSFFAGELRVLLLPATLPPERRDAWQHGLTAIGLGSERVFTDAALAGGWLNHHD
jgi:hypothetical protein